MVHPRSTLPPVYRHTQLPSNIRLGLSGHVGHYGIIAQPMHSECIGT